MPSAPHSFPVRDDFGGNHPAEPGRAVADPGPGARHPEAFMHEGWPIYAGPDLVYRPDGRKVVILDWKTGDDSDVELPMRAFLTGLSGHLDSATRERVYQEKENQRVRARAAETRRSMRKHLRETERRGPLAA
jgi:hypothetical protein